MDTLVPGPVQDPYHTSYDSRHDVGRGTGPGRRMDILEELEKVSEEEVEGLDSVPKQFRPVDPSVKEEKEPIDSPGFSFC